MTLSRNAIRSGLPMLNFSWRLLAELLARPAIATRVIERAQRPPHEGTTRALGTDHDPFQPHESSAFFQLEMGGMAWSNN
ncbi:Hypothetical protein PSEBR_cmegm90 [Pseudomonas brassicacearum subsp. brassicacearum NFM421]|uniref:Uncharacterized protein n=2 Tax=Pseudomonas TaxID=286 RepID=F2KJB8_PSEBN|nr:Hypothetical protein PSEBR_cmegm90 [Pseudomonas brassicacearum subsp. brassicacearum NFM421]